MSLSIVFVSAGPAYTPLILHVNFSKLSIQTSNEVEPCFEKILEDEMVDILILAGHNHYYARAEKKWPSGKKTIHITTGGGGEPENVMMQQY